MTNPDFINVLRRINFREYIDNIQDEMGIIIKEVGLGFTEDERENGRYRLLYTLKDLSQRLSTELGFTGDYNISFMLTLGMITTAWASFILKAKSLDNRRSEHDRFIMESEVENMTNAFKEIISQAISYGEIYDTIK